MPDVPYFAIVVATFCDVRVTSALLLIATKSRTSHHLGDGPISDISQD
jgi:hypothetical protein